jgi:hypothetical protein
LFLMRLSLVTKRQSLRLINQRQSCRSKSKNKTRWLFSFRIPSGIKKIESLTSLTRTTTLRMRRKTRSFKSLTLESSLMKLQSNLISQEMPCTPFKKGTTKLLLRRKVLPTKSVNKRSRLTRSKGISKISIRRITFSIHRGKLHLVTRWSRQTPFQL